MILDRMQRFLTAAFLTVLLFSQALVFVAVRAAGSSSLEAIFIDPVGENLSIGDSIYFQAMLSSDDSQQFDFVVFNLKSFEYGLDENYQASLQNDGTWKAQNAWHTRLNYQPGTYYLSAVAYNYQDNGQLDDIYNSDYKLINLYGQLEVSAEAGQGYFESPTEGQVIDFSDPMAPPSSLLDIRFNIENTIVGGNLLSSYVDNIRFDISRYSADGADTSLVESVIVSQGVDSSTYSVWRGAVDLQDAQKYILGNYNIEANITLKSGTVSMDVENAFMDMDKDVDFQIIRSATEPLPTSDPTTITVTSPNSANPVTGDTLVVTGSLDKPLPSSDRQVKMTLSYRGSLPFSSPGPYILSNLGGANSVLYGTTIILSGTSNPPDGSWPIPQFPNGTYTMTFTLTGSGINDVFLGSSNFELARATVSEGTITLNSPQAGANIVGNQLTLSFATNFTAQDFYYYVISSSTPSIGVEGYIDGIQGVNTWTKTISALQHSDLINDYYKISAIAHHSDGRIVNFGPIVIYWQISEEEDITDPSLRVYVPSSSQLGPDDSVWASANVPNVSFKLRNSANNIYTLSHTAVTCSANNVGFLSPEVINQAIAAGHQYCFYAVLGDGSSTDLPNGNYNFYTQYASGTIVTSSLEETISYFNAANAEEVPTPTFQFLGITPSATVSGPFHILVASDLDQSSLSVQLKKRDSTQILRTFTVPKGDWNTLSYFGINASASSLPFIYIKDGIDSTQLANGSYTLVIVGHVDNTINFSIYNSASNEPPASPTPPTNPTPPTPPTPTNPGGNNTNTNNPGNTGGNNQPVVRNQPIDPNDIGIDPKTTCSDWGITDLAECQRFTAIKDSLDPACLKLSIFEPVACEEHIYRTKTSAECQVYGIVDQEDCRNYLLEKYGSRVDCRLSSANLCNDVLKNRYLGRLVVGQKLSDEINSTIDPLIGKNISIKELSSSLADRGINNTEALPILSDDESKVFLARAQKETILESEDKLTILNQAVIILDTDGDGLSDDLEDYYGTDVNNSDTDGDGYSDGTEINNGYDPAGPGPLVKTRTNFDRVVLSGEGSLEQPKTNSDKIDANFQVSTVDKSSQQIKLKGQAEADTWVNLYLYSSLPLVMVTKTDASGNWSYDIKKSLTDGHHKVFVTVNDDTGKIVKQSRPISFLIKEAQAVTVDDYFDEAGTNEKVNNFFIYYILGGAFLVFLALGIVVFVHKGKNQNLEV